MFTGHRDLVGRAEHTRGQAKRPKVAVHVDQVGRARWRRQRERLLGQVEHACRIPRQDGPFFCVVDGRGQGHVERSLDRPCWCAGAEQQALGANRSGDGFDGAEMRQATRFEIQLRPTLQCGQAVTQLRIVRADEHHPLVACRRRADSRGIAEAADGQQQGHVPRAPDDGLERFAFDRPALLVGEKAQRLDSAL